MLCGRSQCASMTEVRQGSTASARSSASAKARSSRPALLCCSSNPPARQPWRSALAWSAASQATHRTAAPAAGAAAAAPATRAGVAAAASSADDASKVAAKAAAKTGGRFVPGVGSVISGAAALYDFSKGDILGGALNTIGIIPGLVGWVGTLGRLGLEGTRIAGGIDNKSQKPAATSSASAKTVPAKPQSQVIPPSTKPSTTSAATPATSMTFNQQMSDLEKQASSIDFTQAPQYGEVNITPEEGNQVSSQPSQVNIKPLLAQTDRVSTQVNIGPAPAPAPNVIYRRVGSSAQQRSGAAPTGGPVNQVPSISASNPDNFYVLYSQVNYNVVT